MCYKERCLAVQGAIRRLTCSLMSHGSSVVAVCVGCGFKYGAGWQCAELLHVPAEVVLMDKAEMDVYKSNNRGR